MNFLYKNSFFRFYLSIANGKRLHENYGMVSLIIFGVTAMLGTFVGVIPALAGDSSIMQWLALLSFFLLLFGLIYGLRLRGKPNVVSILPVSHVKKSIWFVLAPAFSTLLFIIYFLIAFGLIYAVARLVFLFLGEAGIPLFDDSLINSFKQIGGMGWAFLALHALIFWATGIWAGLTKRKFYRNFGLTVFVILNALTFILVFALSPNGSVGETLGGCSPFIAESYILMPNLWVILPVTGAVAAVLIGFAGYVVYKYFNPKKY